VDTEVVGDDDAAADEADGDVMALETDADAVDAAVANAELVGAGWANDNGANVPLLLLLLLLLLMEALTFEPGNNGGRTLLAVSVADG
jgi:hypothetical protein